MFSLGLGPPVPRAGGICPALALLCNHLPDLSRTWLGRVLSSPWLGSRRGINIPAQVLLRAMLPSFPPPASPGKVILGWRDDNRKYICRLPSNFLMGASWKLMSCAVPLGLCSW